MRILIVTPKQPHATQGNAITCRRWADLLSRLKHDVRTATGDQQLVWEDVDCLIALHATRSHRAIAEYRQRRPDHPIILVMTGTDLHCDLDRTDVDGDQCRQSLAMATRIVLLEPESKQLLPSSAAMKAVVIFQSSQPMPPSSLQSKIKDTFDVAVVGHLRPIKDPFACAEAAALLPTESKIQVTHWGAALSSAIREQANSHTVTNPRYEWIGELDHQQSRLRLANSDLMVISSLNEGGPAAISEAIVDGVPIIAHENMAIIGLLTRQYPGLYQNQSRDQLAKLMIAAETSPPFYQDLKSFVEKIRPDFLPDRELAALKDLLNLVIG